MSKCSFSFSVSCALKQVTGQLGLRDTKRDSVLRPQIHQRYSFIEGGTIISYYAEEFIPESLLDMSPLFSLLKYGLSIQRRSGSWCQKTDEC